MTPGAFLVTQANATSVSQKMLAAIACLSYKRSVIPPAANLTSLRKSTSAANGFDGEALFHAASQSLIFTNRGAEGLISFRDWVEGFKAATRGDFRGPIQSAFDFMEDVVRRLGAQRGLGGVTWDVVDEVWCTGHSWGGALAEAQVALGPAAYARLGLAKTPTSGVGIGSAGFANAIEALAASEGLEIVSDVHTWMDHFLRHADPIRAQPRWRTLGDVYWLADIWSPISTFPPRGGTPIWSITPVATVNHDRFSYFDFLEVPSSRHIYLANDDDGFRIFDGEAPLKRDFGTRNPDDVLLGQD
jgi:hypothetical protein